jgi:hypothetical protein
MIESKLEEVNPIAPVESPGADAWVMLSYLHTRLLGSRRLPSFAGRGLPERMRSTAFAFLGLTAALGLALVAIFAQLSFPVLAPAPAPLGPAGESAVSRSLALGRGSRALAPRRALLGDAEPALGGGEVGGRPALVGRKDAAVGEIGSPTPVDVPRGGAETGTGGSTEDSPPSPAPPAPTAPGGEEAAGAEAPMPVFNPAPAPSPGPVTSTPDPKPEKPESKPEKPGDKPQEEEPEAGEEPVKKPPKTPKTEAPPATPPPPASQPPSDKGHGSKGKGPGHYK